MNILAEEVKGFGRFMVASLLWVFAVLIALSIFSVGSAFAEMDAMNHDGHLTEDTKDTATTKTVDGLVATIKVYPKVIDLYLTDVETTEVIKDAEVEATVVYANGHRIIKNLIGMKMGEGYSYMNSVDMSTKGDYTIHLMIKRGGDQSYSQSDSQKYRMIHMEFIGEVK